jgi:hypothetical protein
VTARYRGDRANAKMEELLEGVLYTAHCNGFVTLQQTARKYFLCGPCVMPQKAWRHDELTGGKSPVLKEL